MKWELESTRVQQQISCN